METSPQRILSVAAAVALAAWGGGALGSLWGIGIPAAVVAAAAAAAVAAGWDARKAARVVAWLQAHGAAPRPQDPGLWNDLSYRIDRELHARMQLVAQEKQRLADILMAIEASPNGVTLLDESQRIVWCNSVAADHFGLDSQRDRLQVVTNLVRAPAFVQYLEQHDFRFPVQLPAPHGRGVLSVLAREYGQGMRLLLSQDVTEREAAEHMRRDFVANVSHEIRTPLTVLAGFIETMGSVPLTEVERTRVLSLMAQQTQRMQNLVSDLLTLAKLEGGPRPPVDRWVPVERLMRQTEADARVLSAGSHTLRFGGGNGAEISGADTEITSALGNLVSNALRYTPPERQGVRGSIEVRWRVLGDGRGEFEVRDNGVGIAKEHLPRIAERFYRADSSRSRETGGTGLGLSIVKHVMLRHGGSLEVESEVGQGSVFRLLFPAMRVRARAGEDASKAAALVAAGVMVEQPGQVPGSGR